jgi:LysM repeat protein
MEYYVPDQVHGGSQSLQYGKRYATHTAGAFQRVSGITPGVKLRFTAWGFVYGKDQNSSKTLGYVHMRIGIDPTGGTNVFGGSVVWSPEAHPVAINSGSNWHQFSVEAEAQSETVTVFLYSSPEWPMDEALTSQWDDTSLVVTTPAAPPTNTPPPPLPTRTLGPPPATATPRPDGSVVHTVQSGETLWSIAIQYSAGTSMPADQMLEQIKKLNNNPALIYSGQELVIAVPQNPLPVASSATEGATEAATQPESPTTEAQSPTAEAQSSAAEPQSPAADNPPPAAQAQPSAASSAICVLAYHDRNVNGAYDPDTEEKLPNAGFTLSNQNGNVVGSYVSDGVNEPHCFEQLVQDTYLVQLTKPAGYNAVTSEYWAITLQQGQTANIILGNVRDPDAPEADAPSPIVAGASEKSPTTGIPFPTEENTEGEKESESKSLLARAGEVAIGVSGIFVLLLAGAVGVAFVASRRRM